jgi:hypothetical protein
MILQNLNFDPLNPVPLLKVDSYSYQASKSHSELLDQWLGLNMEDIERELRKLNYKNEQTWAELSVQSFQTPYLEIRSALDLLNLRPGDRVVDLGSAYNRMGYVMGRYYPLNFYTGVEIAEPRVQHSRERFKYWNFKNLDLRIGNLSEMEVPESEHYFIYDFGHNKAIQNVLENLKTWARKKSIQVIARGRASRHFILNENPWLLNQHPPQHFEHFSLFRS